MKKEVNKNFFKKWNYEMAYTLGFLYADGSITLKNNSGYLSFYSSDKDLLDFIKLSMNSDHKISKRSSKSGNVYRIQIGDKNIIKDLAKIGLKQNKTKRMKIPNIPAKYISNFILGFFDGDGNVWTGYINKKRKNPTYVIQVSFTSASYLFLKDLHIILTKLGINGGFISPVKDKNCSRLILSINDSLQIYKIMYNTTYTPFYLKRKKVVFDRFINMRL